jgi:AraC family transcriptional regulator of adaptative response / DNA-3-methyladenine glycosylase II
METLDPDLCYSSLQSRDSRFDGRFFVAVTSTGIYCRPICPARTPKRQNCRFFSSAAAAQEEGFRPCLRCRPESAPDLAVWRGTSVTVSRGLALIAQGALDGEEDGVETLAARLGVGGRHLRRLFRQHLGASPVTVAQTRRVLFARQLLAETRLPMTEVALAAGFGSLRRFNETFQHLYGRPPGDLRQRSADREELVPGEAVSLFLAWKPPYDWPALMAFLRGRALEGMEVATAESYSRTVRLGDICGSITIRRAGEREGIIADIHFPDVTALPHLVMRIRRVFDLAADVALIGDHLRQDDRLAPLITARPGLRVPGGWDGFELAVRAVLGQQVSVAAARNLGGRLIALCGRQTVGREIGLTRCFPTPEEVLDADLSALGMPGSRKATLRALAEAALADTALFLSQGTIEATVARLKQVKGIGDWTAHYIALRVVREPDAFPASDIGLMRAMAGANGTRPSAGELLARAEVWRPWRGYAAQYLWANDPGLPLETGE